METEDAVTLILKTTGTQNLSDKPTRETAKSVVLTLGCLALAIDQAGAVIRKGLCSMEEYCEIYSRRRKKLLSQKAVQGQGDYRYTVYTTWEISLRMIEENGGEAARDAIELLHIFSFLHHDGISEEIFHQAWENLQKDTHSGWMRSHQTSLPTGICNLGLSSHPECCVNFVFVLSDQSRHVSPCFNPSARTYMGSRSIEPLGRRTNLDAGCLRDVRVNIMDVSDD
jgi:hypothetical protein